MIQIIAGEKGEGKTKRLLQMANEEAKTAKGHIVFIDDDNRHMYDLHYDIRFVETSDFIMKDQQVFFGFICGILSQDGDIEKIFIDGINNIIKALSPEDFSCFVSSLDKLSNKMNVDFAMIISAKADSLPDTVQKYLI